MAIPSKRPDCNADTVLPAVATNAAPTYAEGDAVPLSVDLNGTLRTSAGGGGGGGDASAANQTTMIGHLDGLEGSIGTTADAAATAGSTGSLSAKLRLMSSQLDAIQTAVQTLDNAIAGNEMQVDVLTMPSTAVTNVGTFATQVTSIAAGTNNIGDVDIASIAAGDNNIGNVDVVTLPALPAGNNNIGDVDIASGTLTTVTTVTTVSTLTGGGVAHDAVDSGNPIKVGLKAETSPKGITLVADGDRTDAYADADGFQFVRLNTSGADAISESVSNTDGASTAFTNFSAVASTKNYITAYTAFRTDAGTSMAYIDLRDGTAGSVLWRIPLPPTGGACSPPYNGPCLFKTSANTALAFDVSSALSTVYLSVSGYQSKV